MFCIHYMAGCIAIVGCQNSISSLLQGRLYNINDRKIVIDN